MARFVSFALVALVGIVSTAHAQPSGFARRFSTAITETSASDLTDYQVRLVLDTQTLIAAGQLQPDARDLRFTSADCLFTSYPYWIESGSGTTSTVVWIKIPSIAASSTRHIFVWHDNASATSESSIAAVFDGVTGTTDSLSATAQAANTNLSGSSDAQRGFRFTALSDLLVVRLARFSPSSNPRTITIFEFPSGTILHQQDVAGASATWGYGDLAQPLWLTKGNQYLLEMFHPASDATYYFGAAPTTSADITYHDMRYCNGCTANTMPTNSLGGMHYGYSDFLYYKRKHAASDPVQLSSSVLCDESATCDSDCSAVACGDAMPNASAGEECDDGDADETDDCLATCVSASCGDGFVRDGVEQCDDGDADETDDCLSTCASASCGDGFVHTGVEQCDDDNADDSDACLATCLDATCGDGFVHAGVESCDDGNVDDTDACLSTCAPASCGDGFVEAGVEECDDDNADDSDACLSTCVSAFCGDGFLHAGAETCDDGDAEDDDACLTTCVPASCGDGFVRLGTELCDDGNLADDDACLTTCVPATCGDGFVHSGVESCDDADSDDNDECLPSCASATCGDGVVQVGVETCDDGNLADADACPSDCQVARCGDGFVRLGSEICDDGNTSHTDACLPNCQSAMCGDGAIAAGVEQCDDGNALDGDGCSALCRRDSGDPSEDETGARRSGGCATASGAGSEPPIALLSLALVLCLAVRRRARRA